MSFLDPSRSEHSLVGALRISFACSTTVHCLRNVESGLSFERAKVSPLRASGRMLRRTELVFFVVCGIFLCCQLESFRLDRVAISEGHLLPQLHSFQQLLQHITGKAQRKDHFLVRYTLSLHWHIGQGLRNRSLSSYSAELPCRNQCCHTEHEAPTMIASTRTTLLPPYSRCHPLKLVPECLYFW